VSDDEADDACPHPPAPVSPGQPGEGLFTFVRASDGAPIRADSTAARVRAFARAEEARKAMEKGGDDV
jgi:hypothetical protein